VLADQGALQPGNVVRIAPLEPGQAANATRPYRAGLAGVW
jgi:hypothetical protein